MKRTIDPLLLEKRNTFLVSEINRGISSSILCQQFNITRERVCQIYFKKTGKSINQKKLEKKMESLASIPTKYCKQCNKPIFDSRRYIYCSSYCRLKLMAGRRENYTVSCTNCRKIFYSLKTTKYGPSNPSHHFHSHACYLEWAKEHSKFGKSRQTDKEIDAMNKRNKKVITLLKSGTSVKDIATTLHATRETIYTIARREKFYIKTYKNQQQFSQLQSL